MLTLAITVCFLGTLFFLGYVMTYQMLYRTKQYVAKNSVHVVDGYTISSQPLQDCVLFKIGQCDQEIETCAKPFDGNRCFSIPDCDAARKVLDFAGEMTYETCRSYLQTADLFESHEGSQAKPLCELSETEVEEEILELATFSYQMSHVVNNQSTFPRFLRLQVIHCLGYEGYRKLTELIDRELSDQIEQELSDYEERTELDTSDADE